MRLKKIWKIVIICLIFILTSGCGIGKNSGRESDKVESEEDSEMVQERLMTREYAIEHGIATAEELETVDFEAMVAEYEWVEGEEELRDMRTGFLRLKDGFLLDEYIFDYQYLVDTPKSEGTLTESEVKNIKTIGFECNEGTYFASMIFDLSEGKAYLGDGQDLLRKGVTPKQEIALTDEQIEAVKNHVISSGVLEWQEEYEGVNPNDTDWFWWILYYELEDGSVYAYDGSGVVNGTPENYREFVKGLQAFFNS